MCTCVSEGTCTRVQCLLRPEGGVRPPGTGTEPPDRVLQPHPGPLQEQQEALLTTEPSLQLEKNKKNPLNQKKPKKHIQKMFTSAPSMHQSKGEQGSQQTAVLCAYILLSLAVKNTKSKHWEDCVGLCKQLNPFLRQKFRQMDELLNLWTGVLRTSSVSLVGM